MKFTLITFIIFYLAFPCLAQNKQIEKSVFSDQSQLTFYLLDVESGLSHNYVNNIEQDSLGFIWIATLEGLNRYDGQNFTIYRKNNLVPANGPADNYVQHIGLNSKNQLMLSTSGGFNIYDPKTDLFEFKGQNFDLLKNNVSTSLNGPEGSTIIGVFRKGIQIIDQEKVLHTFTNFPNDPNTISSNQVNSLCFQGDSILWVGTFDNGLNKINYKDKTVQRIPANSSISKSINCLYADSTGNLWIGGNDGIQIITTHGDTLKINSAYTPDEGLSDSNVLCFENDPMGNIWAGTRNGGLNIIAPVSLIEDKKLKIKWYLPGNDGSSVFNRTVSTLKLAKDGNMWIGTSTGVNFVNPKGDPIQLIQRNLSKKETISHERIGSLAESKNGYIWIGTDGGGLDHYNPSSGKVTHYTHQLNDPKSISNDYIISLLEDSRGRLWAGSYQGGLNLLDYQSGTFQHYLQGKQEDGNDVRVIFEDSKKQIWVGTNRGGLYRYHEPSNDFDYVKQLGKIDIRAIDEDKNGNLWLATFDSGIIRYNYLTGETEFFNESTVFGFPTEIIFSLLVLDNGEILGGTRYEGLVKLDPKNKTVAVFTQENGLSNNTINSISADKDGKIWLGTFNGISYYDPKSNQVGNLNSYNNIQQSEFNIGAILSCKSGKIYLGGNKGINVFDPKTLQTETTDLPLVFTELRLMNKKVAVHDQENELGINKSVSFLEKLQFRYDQSLISLDFVALKYPIGKDVSYAYKLEPYHRNWIETNHVGTANLSNIPPGNYILKVRAQNSNQEHSENQIAILITPPFWKTWPAYLLYIILVISLLYAGMRYYSERLKLKNSLVFEKKQRQLEQELNEERVRFFTGISHELKTPLTLILAPVEDLILEIKNQKQLKGLTLIQKNAKYLFEMINKLLEFRKTELDLNQLNLENHSIVKSINQWTEQYLPLAKHRKIKIVRESPKKDIIAAVDIEKLHIIFNNLLSNALKYCSPRDQVTICIEEEKEHFMIMVKDNGPGIEISDQEKVFNWYYQAGKNTNQSGTGIGLALTKRLVEDHQGSLKLHSAKGEGCEFIITMPKQKIAEENIIKKDSQTTDTIIWSPELEKQEVSEQVSNLDLKEEKEVILLIDDNPQILSYLSNLLGHSYDLIFAKDGKEGLDKAIQFVPDLVLSDVMMPHKDGIDLCSNLKKNQATTHIPVILLSAKDNADSITSGFGMGADDYITKPFNSQILKSRIKNLLEARIRLRDYYLGKIEIDQSFKGNQESAISQEKAFLKDLEKHILNEIGNQNTDVDSISQLMGMSRTSLFRKLKALTGQNINQYIRTVKIKRAAYLIQEENLGIAQAAYEVGFSSPKYFRKLFKEQYGYLPSEIPSDKSLFT